VSSFSPALWLSFHPISRTRMMYKDITIIRKCDALEQAHRVGWEHVYPYLITFVTVPTTIECNHKIAWSAYLHALLLLIHSKFVVISTWARRAESFSKSTYLVCLWLAARPGSARDDSVEAESIFTPSPTLAARMTLTHISMTFSEWWGINLPYPSCYMF
jgi:hypothetical protein